MEQRWSNAARASPHGRGWRGQLQCFAVTARTLCWQPSGSVTQGWQSVCRRSKGRRGMCFGCSLHGCSRSRWHIWARVAEEPVFTKEIKEAVMASQTNVDTKSICHGACPPIKISSVVFVSDHIPLPRAIAHSHEDPGIPMMPMIGNQPVQHLRATSRSNRASYKTGAVAVSAGSNHSTSATSTWTMMCRISCLSASVPSLTGHHRDMLAILVGKNGCPTLNKFEPKWLR